MVEETKEEKKDEEDPLAALEARLQKKHYSLKWLKQPQPSPAPSSFNTPPPPPSASGPSSITVPPPSTAESEPPPGPVQVKVPYLRSLKPNSSTAAGTPTPPPPAKTQSSAHMIEVVLNDRLGKKVRVKVNSDDTVETLKKLTAAQLGTHWDRLVVKKWRGFSPTHTHPLCLESSSS